MELNSSTSNQSVASTSPPLIQGSTSSSRSLDQFDVEDAIAAQANSLYFTLFPAEIRRKILIEAFGDRVLHIVHSKDPRTGQLQWSGGECQNPPLYYPGVRVTLVQFNHIQLILTLFQSRIVIISVNKCATVLNQPAFYGIKDITKRV